MIIVGEVKRTSGIYLIKNVVNGKVYVGSSVNLRKRLDNHKHNLLKGKHGNIHLQNAWNKYGGENFSFTVIELVSDKDKLIEREQCWIDNLNAFDRSVGYNVLHTAGSPLGVKFSDARKKAIRLGQKTKPFFQFDLEGNLVKEWISLNEMSRELNVSQPTISSSLKTKSKFMDSYFLISKDEFTEELLASVLLYKRKTRKGLEQPSAYKKIKQYDKNGEFIQTWDAIKFASESLNIKECNISACCTGKQKTAGGFIWSYAN